MSTITILNAIIQHLGILPHRYTIKLKRNTNDYTPNPHALISIQHPC